MKISVKIISIFLSFIFCFATCITIAPTVFAESENVVINEVCSSNKGNNGNATSATNSDGSYCDWVEIYNRSSSPVDLSGWGLSDGKSNFFKFTFKSGTSITAGGFMLIYCSKSFIGEQDDLCASLGISSDGEKLYLTSPDESMQDTVDVPALKSDVTYGRYPDGGNEFKELSPTPVKSNTTATSASLSMPVFSNESGMYTSGFSLTITTTEENAEIWYTTDGSDPKTSDTKILYTGAITVKDRTGEKNVLAAVKPSDVCISYSGSMPSDTDVDKGTVIRAVCKKGDVYSKPATKSYFVGNKVCSYGDIPILSVTTDFDNLFDYNKGIYCNGKVWDDFQVSHPGVTESWLAQTNSTQRGREWERDCHIDLIESDGSVAISQDCGMRTQGGSSRTSLQKSLRFFARKEYSESYFNYPLFDNALDEKGNVIDKYKTFVVRNGGNDSVYLKYTDNFIQNLVADRDIETQQGRGVLVFLDGEYWGVFMMQEDYTEDYFEQKYGVDKDDVIMVKCGEIEIGNDEDLQLYKDMVSYINDSRITDERYKKVGELIDLQSFADYMAIELYICNADWPNNNYAMWRTRKGGGDGVNDGRWRFILYDTEYSTWQYNAANTSYNYDNYTKAFQMNLGQVTLDTMLGRLRLNDDFKKMFVTTSLDLRNVNFKYTDVLSALKSTHSYYTPYLADYKKRFHNQDSWNISNRYSQLQTFFNKRPSYVIDYLNSAGWLRADTKSFYLSANIPKGGKVAMNTVTVDFTKYTSTGLYCKYLDCYDTSFTALPNDGYVFVKWDAELSDYELYNESVTLNKDNYNDIVAEFIRENEILYGDVNNDGKVDIKDLLQLKKYTVKIKVGIFKAASDVNFDSSYNLKDILMIKKHIVGIIPDLGK